MDIHVKIKDLIFSKQGTILSAMKQMDEIRRKLLFIYDHKDFIGLLSIGDIQRAIINGVSMNEPVENILRDDITLGYINESLDEIKEKMMDHRAECMPILDEQNRLVEVYFWEEIFPSGQTRIKEEIDNDVVIMAGGKGMRMKPITHVIPKPLIPLGEKTMLERIIESFHDVGCRNYYLSVNYKADMIQHYFNGHKYAPYITYIQEEKPLGTAGSLFLLKDKIRNTFFVSNCDILIDQDYREILMYHKENDNDLTIVAALKHYKIPYGIVKTKKDGLLDHLQEKPELTFSINSGLYILEPQLLEEIPENHFFNITDFVPLIRKLKGRVGVFPVSEGSWVDIGDWSEYIRNLEKRY